MKKLLLLGSAVLDCSTTDLLSAIRKVHSGGTHVSGHAASRWPNARWQAARFRPARLKY